MFIKMRGFWITSLLVSTYLSLLPACTSFGFSLHPRRNVGRAELQDGKEEVPPPTRRAVLTGTANVLTSFAFFTALTKRSNAFENRLDDKYADAIAQTGTQPTDLGHKERVSKAKGAYIGLKQCGTSPNCWCSSSPFSDAPARFIPAWNGGSIEDVKQVIDTYTPGQNGIDGGGFKVIEYDEKEKYMYVQFQSYKAGYIDDFECWFNPQSQKFDVRSASRVGMSDLGVNAKRLEYIAGRLEKEFGWNFERRKSGALV